MTRIALVVSDVDGTLLTKDKVLTDKAARAVRQISGSSILPRSARASSGSTLANMRLRAADPVSRRATMAASAAATTVASTDGTRSAAGLSPITSQQCITT